jgi:aryl-alcohol dehydrogenase-like predicted oxidoreductase
MNTTQLGITGITVSNLCLGSMQFGWTADEAASFAVMDAFVEAGGNFIDTADIYSTGHRQPGGVSRGSSGRWMKARGNRASIVGTTKVRGPMWKGADGEGLSRAHITRPSRTACGGCRSRRSTSTSATGPTRARRSRRR